MEQPWSDSIWACVLALSAGALAGVISSRFPFAMARDNLVPKPRGESKI